MERESPTDAETRDDDRSAAAAAHAPPVNPHAHRPTVTVAATRGEDTDASNELTIIGHGTPSSFEITVDGEISVTDEPAAASSTVVSGSTVEGAIEDGTIRVAFTGDLTDVTFVDREITGVSPATTPNVHVDYAAPERSQS
ncbi:hypothetical protein [Natronolimnohabitans innermongolicus]|uniref:Uncharacterized protein n=1 Tax=Natronolimnohabitans innermongolicus JCM 12255 TaxID=1227499 RepID=L9WHN3_9EURY|nr:hypothetical protein [Natronolimnohabitans innermongolicus]ELY48756.1 hypothetical protein C493_21761 [Natronolimnohabitans innermongolicus JCM 12255]